MACKALAGHPILGWLGLVLVLSAVAGCSNPYTTGDGERKPADSTAKAPYDAGVEGLPDALPTAEWAVRDGDTVRLTVSFVAKWISGQRVRMLAYNGMVPGPTFKVSQGDEIILLLKNETNLPTTLHSHGVRLDYRSDGVPYRTQEATDSGKSFAYRIRFPDPGIFWYHPHYREDYQMELGLYGSYLVAPKDTTYWPPVHREVVLMIDDLSMRGNVIEPFYRNIPDHTLMGRFGNVLLVNGDTAFTMRVKRNETIRFYVVNASNSRVYNLQYSRDMDLNIVGADNGRFEYPSSRENYLVAPSERAIFQLWFNDGLSDYDTLDLWNLTPGGVSVLARFVYDADTAKPDLRGSISMRQSLQAAASIDPFRPYFDKLPDEEILLSGYMDMSGALAKPANSEGRQHDPDPSNRMGVEWSDSVHGEAMLHMNASATPRNMHWSIKDVRTGKENHEIDWVFKRGSKVLIRVRNDSAASPMDAPIMKHPMPHPIHFHGQRFLVVRENGVVPLEGLVWRDSYLIGRGYTVDLLLDADNPGSWMFHCHIAEHLENDMMGHFKVLDEVIDEVLPLDWSLSLKLGADVDSLRRDSLLAMAVPETVTGRVNAFMAPGTAITTQTAFLSALDGFAYFLNADDGSRPLAAALDTNGAFSFSSSALSGPGESVRIKVFLKPKTSGFRPSPDTLRLTLDRRGRFAWSLDVELAGDAAFAALRAETDAVSRMQGDVSGKVNGYDPLAVRDTLFVRNAIYPELFADVPLGPDGGFGFPAEDLVASLDGFHALQFFLKPVVGLRQMDPDTLRINLSVP